MKKRVRRLEHRLKSHVYEMGESYKYLADCLSKLEERVGELVYEFERRRVEDEETKRALQALKDRIETPPKPDPFKIGWIVRASNGLANDPFEWAYLRRTAGRGYEYEFFVGTLPDRSDPGIATRMTRRRADRLAVRNAGMRGRIEVVWMPR